MFFVARVVRGQEKIVLNMLVKKAEKEKHGVYSIIFPPSWVGYFIIEGDNYDSVARLVFGLRPVKGVLQQEVSEEEVMAIFEKGHIEEEKIEKDGLALVLNGPLKGEKVKVMRINEDKGNAVVMPIEMPVPIPVTVHIKDLKPLREEE